MEQDSTVIETIELDTIMATPPQTKNDILLDADSLLLAYPSSESTLFPKQFPQQFKKKYQTEEFNYDKNKPKVSIAAKINKLIKRFLEKIFGKIDFKYERDVINFLAILIIAAAFYFIIYFFIRKGGLGIFGTKNKKVSTNPKELAEDIHEINFGKIIAEKEQQGKYREAIRYQYLYVLKKLTDKNLIEWIPEKTNKDYVKEFQHPTLMHPFQHLSAIFDYVWYGEFPITSTHYLKYKNQFNDFTI